MALSLGFGVLFVTFIALGLVPVLFMLVEDLRFKPRARRQPAGLAAAESALK